MRFASPGLPLHVATLAPLPAGASLGLHVSLPTCPHSPPSAAPTRGKKKTQLDAEATGQVLLPAPPGLGLWRQLKSRRAWSHACPVSEASRFLGGTSRPPPSLRSRELAVKQYGTRPALSRPTGCLVISPWPPRPFERGRPASRRATKKKAEAHSAHILLA